MFALHALRRTIYPSLEEWEFLEIEIDRDHFLGEGGFAGVYRCQWLGQAAAVKVFKLNPSGSGTILRSKVRQFTSSHSAYMLVLIPPSDLYHRILIPIFIGGRRKRGSGYLIPTSFLSLVHAQWDQHQ